MQRTLISVLLGLSASAVFAQTEVTATLAGHAYLPFSTTATAPKDAGQFFETSGKFANDPRQRVEKLGSVAANTFVGDPQKPRASGGFLPIQGQSVQGFSGIHAVGDGTFDQRNQLRLVTAEAARHIGCSQLQGNAHQIDRAVPVDDAFFALGTAVCGG